VQMLQLVLQFKILLTFAIWSLPLLILRPSWLIAIGFPDPSVSIVFIRLYGAACFSLGVGYVLGYLNLSRGENINNTVIVGIISNSLACIILLIYGFSGSWNNWGQYAKAYMWGSAIATGIITVGLPVFKT
jgi:hypothetical protein